MTQRGPGGLSCREGGQTGRRGLGRAGVGPWPRGLLPGPQLCDHGHGRPSLGLRLYIRVTRATLPVPSLCVLAPRFRRPLCVTAPEGQHPPSCWKAGGRRGPGQRALELCGAGDVCQRGSEGRGGAPLAGVSCVLGGFAHQNGAPAETCGGVCVCVWGGLVGIPGVPLGTFVACCQADSSEEAAPCRLLLPARGLTWGDSGLPSYPQV